MKISNNFDTYIRNNKPNNSYKYENQSNPFFTAISDTNNTDSDKKMSKKAKYTIGSIISAGLGFFGIKQLSKKPKKNITTELKPIVETAIDISETLIKKLKPKNEILAREFFPILEKNSQALKLEQKDYNTVLTGINNKNKKYLQEEGFEFISSKMKSFEDLIASPAEDILTLIKYLSKENQEIFTKIINDRNTFKLVDMEDVVTYLKHITPENKDYVFNELAPMLENYSQKLKIKTADKHARLLNQITPQTQDLIPTIANSKELETQRISKYQLLLNVNKDNKDCVNPLLANLERLGLKPDETISLLKQLKNSQASLIPTVGKNIQTINGLNLDVKDIFSILKNENDAKILDKILSNPEGYRIEELIDIKNYLKNLNPDNLEFINSEVLPRLTKYAKVLGVQYAEEIAETMGKITPKTIDSIDTVAKYAKDFGDEISYTAFLQAVTDKNQKNIPEVMAKIKSTDLWGNTMVSAEDFAQLLNAGL